MTNAVLFGSGPLLLAVKLLGLVSFNWEAFCIVATATTLVLVRFVCRNGPTVFIVLIIAAAFALYWGLQRNTKRPQELEMIKQLQTNNRIGNQIDIYFEPSLDDPERAAEFQCTLVLYDAADSGSRKPTVAERKVHIAAGNAGDFYRQVQQQLQSWFAKQFSTDAEGQERRVTIYMKPYPGEAVYERLKQMAEQNGIRKCVVARIDAKWKTALGR